MRSGVANRSIYEESMLQYGTQSCERECHLSSCAHLRYVYYHNWFKGKPCGVDESCPATTFSHAFWAGFSGRDKSYAELQRFANEDMGYDDRDFYTQSSKWTLARLQKEVVSAWDHNLLTEDYVYVAGRITYAVRCPDDLRPQERYRIQPNFITKEQFNDWHLAFFFDARPFVKLESRNNILLTAFICLVLCVASMQFSKDANALVLRPVERMIEKVNLIRDNPLAAMKMADDEFKDFGEEMKKHRDTNSREKQHLWLKKYHLGWLSYPLHRLRIAGRARDEAMMETAILEKTIIKLGSLLALGFGEAGASIVANNMQGLESAGVNAMSAGSRVDCIIGSACIRDFSTATEVLQGKVMTFVNQIAEIVHGLVCEFHGAPNKNSGERFLLIWRLGSLNSEQQTRLADMAMVSCVRTALCLRVSAYPRTQFCFQNN
eukprot:g10438.t1